MRMYSSVASASIPLRVEYLCCHCEKENVDNSQFIHLKAESGGSLVQSPNLSLEARKRLNDRIQNTIQDISQGKYRSAYLTCTCSECGKRQPWASFIKTPTWSIVLFVLGVLGLLTCLGRGGEIPSPVRAVVLTTLMILPMAVIELRNLFFSKKVSRLDGKYLPRLSVRAK